MSKKRATKSGLLISKQQATVLLLCLRARLAELEILEKRKGKNVSGERKIIRGLALKLRDAQRPPPPGKEIIKWES